MRSLFSDVRNDIIQTGHVTLDDLAAEVYIARDNTKLSDIVALN